MKKLLLVAISIFLLGAVCGCTRILSPVSEPAAPTENTAAAESMAEPTEEPSADLTLNADGNLDGMEYRYNSTWTETSDPLTNATTRTYDIALENGQVIHLRLVAVNDEQTAAAVEALRTQDEADRESVITGMIAAKDSTLTKAESRRADVPPTGTRAMWAYEGEEKDHPGQYVHGYAYVGGSQLYEVSVATDSAEAYAVFEPAWKSLVNQLKFQDIEPLATAAPTPTPKTASTPKPTQNQASAAEEANGWYTGIWSGSDWDGDRLTLGIRFETMAGDFTSYSIDGDWEGSSGGYSFYGKGEIGSGYVSYNGTITAPDGNSYPMTGTLTPAGSDSLECVVNQSGRYVGTVMLRRQ